MQKNVEIAQAFNDQKNQKIIQLQQTNLYSNDVVKLRRKLQDEELLKLRMFQVAKWEIIRLKEKEMLENLERLKIK